MKAKTRDIYRACHVKYKQGKNKEVIEGYFEAPNKQTGLTLEVNEQCDTVDAANKLAKKNCESRTGMKSRHLLACTATSTSWPVLSSVS